MLFFPPHFASSSPPPFLGRRVQRELPELPAHRTWALISIELNTELALLCASGCSASLSSFLTFSLRLLSRATLHRSRTRRKGWESSWQSSLMRDRKHGGLGYIEWLGRFDLGLEIWSPGPFLSCASWALASSSGVYACHFLHLQVPRGSWPEGSCKAKLRTTVTSPRASCVVWCLSLWFEYETPLGSCIQTLTSQMGAWFQEVAELLGGQAWLV